MDTSILKQLFFLKVGPIFDKAAKLGKETQDAYNLGGWPIFKNWIAEGVASEVNDITGQLVTKHMKMDELTWSLPIDTLRTGGTSCTNMLSPNISSD